MHAKLRLMLTLFSCAIGASLIFSSVKFSNPNPSYQASPRVIPRANTQIMIDAEQAQERNEGFVTGLEYLPASFEGTDVDGKLSWDERGDLIINYDLRLVFDYFLAAIGEESLQTISLRVQAYLKHQLPEEASLQASELWLEYLALLEALHQLDGAVQSGDLSNQEIAEQLEYFAGFRRAYLKPEVADAFFGIEENYHRYRVQQLSNAQSELLLDDVNASTYGFENLHQDLERLRTQEQVVELKKEGASAEEIYQFRRSHYGEQAASRLEQLDVARKHWKTRMDRWLVQREEVLGSGALAQLEKESVLTRLRQENFSSQEIRRVRSLESIYDQKNGNELESH